MTLDQVLCQNKYWLYLTVKETFKILLYSSFLPKACHFFLMHLLKPKAIGNIQSCLWKPICIEEKLKVMATSTLPATLVLCTQMMKETTCFFWVKGQFVSQTQVAICFPSQNQNGLKMKWTQMGTFTLGCHDDALPLPPGLWEFISTK